MLLGLVGEEKAEKVCLQTGEGVQGRRVGKVNGLRRAGLRVVSPLVYRNVGGVSFNQTGTPSICKHF